MCGYLFVKTGAGRIYTLHDLRLDVAYASHLLRKCLWYREYCGLLKLIVTTARTNFRYQVRIPNLLFDQSKLFFRFPVLVYHRVPLAEWYHQYIVVIR